MALLEILSFKRTTSWHFRQTYNSSTAIVDNGHIEFEIQYVHRSVAALSNSGSFNLSKPLFLKLLFPVVTQETHLTLRALFIYKIAGWYVSYSLTLFWESGRANCVSINWKTVLKCYGCLTKMKGLKQHWYFHRIIKDSKEKVILSYKSLTDSTLDFSFTNLYTATLGNSTNLFQKVRFTAKIAHVIFYIHFKYCNSCLVLFVHNRSFSLSPTVPLPD